MGFDRGTLNAVLLATTAGVAIGGVIGIVSPTFASADAATPHHRPPATVVTDVDVLGTDQMTITIRFTNPGRTLRHVAPADITVTTATVVLHPHQATPVDIRPGTTITSTYAFDAPAADARLTLNLPGESLPL